MTITPFVRGTKTRRVKTARLIPGDRVLTVPSQARLDSDGGVRYRTGAAQKKTGSLIRVVESIEPVFHQGVGYYARAGRTYTVRFTDGTSSLGNAPVYTWHAVEGAE